MSKIIDDEIEGTAYGILYSLVNFSLAVIPLIIGIIHDHFSDDLDGYFWVWVFLTLLTIISSFASIAILCLDKKYGNKMSKKD